MALAALALDPATGARVARDNATPHPMKPLNRPWPADTGDAVMLGASSRIAECAADTYLDPGPIPDFLHLTAEQRRAGWERYHAERGRKLAVTDSALPLAPRACKPDFGALRYQTSDSGKGYLLFVETTARGRAGMIVGSYSN